MHYCRIIFKIPPIFNYKFTHYYFCAIIAQLQCIHTNDCDSHIIYLKFLISDYEINCMVFKFKQNFQKSIFSL